MSPPIILEDQDGKEESRSKEFYLRFHPVGQLALNVHWNREWSMTWAKSKKGYVTLPFDEEVINPEQMIKEEEKLESRLVELTLWCPEISWQGKKLPYQAEMRVPTGRIFTARFGRPKDPEEAPGISEWQDENQQRVRIFIPEVENILEKIQMRIVPTDTNKGR